MPNKKEQYKFTIMFNAGDPLAQQTADILNQQGRRKAQFITNAVQHYLHCKETPDIPQSLSSASVDYSVIEKLVRRILAENSSLQTVVPSSQKTVPAIKQDEELQMDEAAELLGEEGLAAIANTMSLFRK